MQAKTDADAQPAEAYANAVFLQEGMYHWKTETGEGASEDLATALQKAIGEGNRTLHLLTGGTLSRSIELKPKLKLYGHENTLVIDHKRYGFSRDGSGEIGFYDMTLQGKYEMVVRISRASHLEFLNVHVRGGGIGIRIDSHRKRPYDKNYWVKDLVVKNCTFKGCRGHGIETYGVEHVQMDNIVATDCGECGVLINKGRACKIGTVQVTRCCYGGGYAGLRFANYCSDSTVEKLIAKECGRGFFTVSDCRNISVKHVDIRDCSAHAILIQHSWNVGIESGTYNGVALNHYTSSDCWIKANKVD